jgi:hypothetical protein
MVMAVTPKPRDKPYQTPLMPKPNSNASKYPTGKPIIQYAIKVAKVGTFTSCKPRRMPKLTTCTPSNIWKNAAMINKPDAVAPF